MSAARRHVGAIPQLRDPFATVNGAPPLDNSILARQCGVDTPSNAWRQHDLPPLSAFHLSALTLSLSKGAFPDFDKLRVSAQIQLKRNAL
jgi:hypothetical protein